MYLILIFVGSIFYIVLLVFVLSLCKVGAQADRDIELMRKRELSKSNTSDIITEDITTEEIEFKLIEEKREAVG